MKETFSKIKGVTANPYEMWFNAAADHLYDLNCHPNFPLRNRLYDWRAKCIGWRLDSEVKEADFKWAVKEAKELLMAIDKLLGSEVKQGDHE
jgi:hypothetical protein